MNICIVAGARPNFIKVAPIIRAIEKAAQSGQNIEYKLVYAGEKEDKTLENNLFADLKMPPPSVYLNAKCKSLNELTGQVMNSFEQYLEQNATDVVIVVDDLASTMAAAIVTKKQGLRLAHLVAGTRSFDINMPKEVNRLVIDGLSDYLFTAGMPGNSVAAKEGAHSSKVYMVGNILMDTLRFNHSSFKMPQIFNLLNLKKQEYIVFTLNRKAIINDKTRLENIVNTLLENNKNTPIIAPLRELAAEGVRDILKKTESQNHIFHITQPLSYLEFGYLTANAKGIITDSGNVAEEATFNQVPCITLNDYTEHIETVKQGTNVLTGNDMQKLSEAYKNMLEKQWKESTLPDMWDGRTAERIVKTLIKTK